MKTLTTLALASLLIVSGVSNAQKIKIYEGDKKLEFLKGQTAFNIEFTNDDMFVGNKLEADYLKEKRNGYNKKTPGKEIVG